MPATNELPVEPLTTLVRREWATFRSRRRLVALTAATLVVILIGLLVGVVNRSVCSEGPIEVACPTDPVGPAGQTVSDQFYFAHQPLGEHGSITARMTAMTGTITYPPPDHDEIVPGLVPWAKAGVIVKDGTRQGSSYAALMVTGSHGVRMQHDYVHDTAGRPGGVSTSSPRWLRLTRAGNTITGEESTDGVRWTTVGTAHLPGLPRTVLVGLFATSPGDLTLRPTGLGGSIVESRFTQASAVFDNVALAGGGTGSRWSHGSVGEMGHTDWERYHRPPGFVESNGTATVTGSGDIAPLGMAGQHTVEDTLVGLAIGLVMLIVLATRFGSGRYRPDSTGAGAPGSRVLAARAVVVGAVTFLTGLVAAGAVLPLGTAVLRANGTAVLAAPALTQVRVVVGVAALLAVAAVLALALGALFRRTWVAILVAISAVVLPYVLGGLPLLPDAVSEWLLRLTPAAGFAVQQTIREYPQVLGHYAPSAGYFPLPWWAGLAVLCGYAAVALRMGMIRARRTVATRRQAEWR
ncbi:hypothetical protein I0C86_10540 [Plantactinospora sp. S1510]|uniref:DUF1349 domain-containing protein n=1 Tax=Plantactinospora alkalitolerans TaxID=2789879 RepID=A0ABS0GT85_9ACTN|nr:hypothetical protein [Plantactinospora alkalitolerans]MBF9129407.1 hypothetical protein [Plantactinospora alkalitolerans]